MNYIKKAETPVCMGSCTKELCCLCLTTTIVPTTTPLTCASFTCVAPWIADPGKTHTPCQGGVCDKHKCCLCLTTTPGPTSTQPCDTNAPPAVAGPCEITTANIRLYSVPQVPSVSENASEK